MIDVAAAVGDLLADNVSTIGELAFAEAGLGDWATGVVAN